MFGNTFQMNCSHLHEDLERIKCADSFYFLSKSITIKTLCLGTTFHIITLVFLETFCKEINSLTVHKGKEQPSSNELTLIA